jgi:hypothetical protein
MKDPEPPPSSSAKPADPPPFDAFREFARKVLSVPKAEVNALEAKYQRERAKKKAKRGPKPG